MADNDSNSYSLAINDQYKNYPRIKPAYNVQLIAYTDWYDGPLAGIALYQNTFYHWAVIGDIYYRNLFPKPTRGELVYALFLLSPTQLDALEHYKEQLLVLYEKEGLTDSYQHPSGLFELFEIAKEPAKYTPIAWWQYRDHWDLDLP